MEYTKFYNPDGSLTQYAFACGYVERYEPSNNNYCLLYMEHNHYHVQIIVNGINDNTRWSVFTHRQFRTARNYYNKLKKQLTKIVNHKP